MLANLARLDQAEPCVVLIDEIEKVFSTKGGDLDGATTTTMLSQLLWWLAEHKSRVLTVMTTNNAKALPPELYREGRIDEVMVFEGLTGADAAKFVKGVVSTFVGASRRRHPRDQGHAQAVPDPDRLQTAGDDEAALAGGPDQGGLRIRQVEIIIAINSTIRNVVLMILPSRARRLSRCPKLWSLPRPEPPDPS